MPYAAIERPSLGLGLLTASLQRQGIESTVLYPNLWFAEEIGLYRYVSLQDGLVGSLLGEWTFSKAAFPDFETDDSEYFRVTGYDNSDNIRHVKLVRQKAIAFIDRVAESILKLQPKIVACSSSFYQHCASLALLRRLREWDPNIITLMGGANCESIMGVTTLRSFPWVDFVCSGEGDDVFPKLCRRLLDRGRDIRLEELPYGVLGPPHRHHDITICAPPRSSANDLDSLPLPDFDSYFETLNNSKIGKYIEPGLPIETSRGCWWGQKQHCTFCGLNGQGMTYRSKSSDRVVEEFRQQSQRYGSKRFFVVDNILDLKHIDTVLPAFNNLPEKYNIFYETKANLKREQVQKLAEAGVRWIQPGIESLHDEALKLMKKGNTAIINLRLLKWGRENGMHVLWNFLVGFPEEDPQWYNEPLGWMPWLVHLQPPSGVGRVRADRFSPYHENAAEYGLELIPQRSYPYIYPLPPEQLHNLAYFFEDAGEMGQKDLFRDLNFDQDLSNTPEHQALKEAIARWNQLFNSEAPMLSIKLLGDDRARLFDTRPCAIAEETILEGLSYQVYTCCDDGPSQRQLVTKLKKTFDFTGTWEDLQPIVEELRSRRVLLQVGDKLLSLALREPVPPLPPLSEHPGGHRDVLGYIKEICNPMFNFRGQRPQTVPDRV